MYLPVKQCCVLESARLCKRWLHSDSRIFENPYLIGKRELMKLRMVCAFNAKTGRALFCSGTYYLLSKLRLIDKFFTWSKKS